MIFIIFTYNRREMLTNLLKELKGEDVFVVDDCSDYDLSELGVDYYSFTSNGGKELFYQRWQLGLKKFRESNHKNVCFLPDDVSNLDLKGIKNLTKQGLKNYAITLANTGNFYRWGHWSTNQLSIEINNQTHKECGYVDGCFVSNRYTLKDIELNKMPKSWFNKKDRSSGVGYQMTMQLRESKALMLMPEKSYLYHGDHDSVMHGDHRKKVPLITK